MSASRPYSYQWKLLLLYAVVAVVVSVLLSACGWSRPSWDGEGRIVGKEYDDADWTTRYRRVCDSSYEYDWFNDEWDWVEDCDQVPYDYLEPERWLIYVEWEYEDDEGVVQSRIDYATVPQYLYEQCEVGQHYSDDKQTCGLR